MSEVALQAEKAARRKTIPGQNVVLHDVDWKTYSRLLAALRGQRGVKLTYDRGTLEIMSPLLSREAEKRLLGRLISALTEELNLPVVEGGSTKIRRQLKRRGLEPDECFWIANAPRIQGKRRLDLRVNPPPDLAVEVDVTKSSLDRLSIYAALGVPEVWRYQGASLTFYAADDQGQLSEATTSRSFPSLAAAELLPFLALFDRHDFNEIVRQFRAWVRQRFQSPAVP